MIKLKAKDKCYGDATRDYIIEFNKEYSLKELTEEILKTYNKDWGYFIISLKNTTITFEYKRGEIITNIEILEQYSNKIIEKVFANGGWSRMDYFIIFKSNCKEKD